MKNKYISFVALAAAALATSCASDDLAEQKQEQNEPRTVTLTASVNEVQTRVGMTKGENNTASFYWHSSDKIFVQTKNGSAYSGAEFSTTTNTGEPSASFTGEIDTDYEVDTYAVYPYDSSNQKHTFDASDAKKLTYVLPASYTSYTPESKIFGTTDDYRSNSTNMPMLGTISGNSIKFKCLGGLAVIRIDKMPATSGTLTVSADQQLSGSFEVADLSASDAQIMTTTASGDNGKVTFTFSGASTTSSSVFYLPLATSSYTNLTIEITYGETTQTIPYGSLTVERAHVTAIPLSTDSKGNLRYIVKNSDGTYTINGHKFVDLGLSSGLLWAATNVGAGTETDYGSAYEFGGATSTINSSWGTAVRVPTKDEFDALISGCTGNWGSKDSTNGYTFTSKSEGNSNSIFLPVSVDGAYYKGRYWSCTISSGTANAYFLHLFRNNSNSSSTITTKQISTAYKFVVRPVAERPTTLE